jgi:hypothetical protein
MIVLVPLPLLMSVPGTAEPGIVTICGEPGLPVTKPVPRDVLTPGVVVILGVTVVGGATTGGGLGMFAPTDGTCAAAEPASPARNTIASLNLIMPRAPWGNRVRTSGRVDMVVRPGF